MLPVHYIVLSHRFFYYFKAWPVNFSPLLPASDSLISENYIRILKADGH